MATKTTFTIKLDTEFDIDLSVWDFPPHYTEEQKHKELLQFYFDECGFESIDFKEKSTESLFEQIANTIKPNKNINTMGNVYSNLNENELKVLECLRQEVVDCTGDEFGYISDAKTPEGLTRNQFKGYVSSLSKKNIITIFDEMDGQFEVNEKL